MIRAFFCNQEKKVLMVDYPTGQVQATYIQYIDGLPDDLRAQLRALGIGNLQLIDDFESEMI